MKLCIVMLDTHRTYIAITEENESIPYGRRLVQFDLTPEQEALVTPRIVGKSGGRDVHEEYGPCWIERTEGRAQ